MARVTQSQIGTGKVRSLPISDKLKSLLTSVGDQLDVNFEVMSGGQTSRRDPALKNKAGGWTGSTRHNDGGAGDVRAYTIGSDGKKQYINIDTAPGQQVWSQIVRLAVAGGATGVGAGASYMGALTVHIGYGNPAVWGGDDEKHPAPPAKWLVNAYQQGVLAAKAPKAPKAPVPATMSPTTAAARGQSNTVLTGGQGKTPATTAPDGGWPALPDVVTPKGYNQVAPAQRNAIAAVPTPRGYNQVTPAQRDAIAAVPGAAAPLTDEQVDLITRTVLGEARIGDAEGQAAVAWVIRNRSESAGFPSDPGRVATQHNSRGVYQFSAWNSTHNQGNNNVNIPSSDPNYQAVAEIVRRVFGGTITDPTKGATFYHTPDVHPSWDRQMSVTAELGGHIFYAPKPATPSAVVPATMSFTTQLARGEIIPAYIGGKSPTERNEIAAAGRGGKSPTERDEIAAALAKAKGVSTSLDGAAASSSSKPPTASTVLTSGRATLNAVHDARDAGVVTAQQSAAGNASGATNSRGYNQLSSAERNAIAALPTGATPAGYNPLTPAQRSAIAALPTASGYNQVAQLQRNAIAALPATALLSKGYNQVTAAQRNGIAALPATALLSKSYNQVAPAQRNAIAALPAAPAPGAYTTPPPAYAPPAAYTGPVGPGGWPVLPTAAKPQAPAPNGGWPVLTPPTQPQAAPAPKPRAGYASPIISAAQPTYTVKAQDTLSDIARAAYGDAAQVRQLMALNGIADPGKLRVGQVLQLRAPAAPAVPASAARVVVRGARAVPQASPQTVLTGGYSGARFGTGAGGVPLNASTRTQALPTGQLAVSGGYLYRSNGDGTYTHIGRAATGNSAARDAFDNPGELGSLSGL